MVLFKANISQLLSIKYVNIKLQCKASVSSVGYCFHKSLNPCHVFRQTPQKDVIVIGARDFEEGFVRRVAGLVEGLAV